MMLRLVLTFAMLFTFFPLHFSGAEEGMLRDSFTNEAGTRSYELFIPTQTNQKKLPLLVMLHGCTQNAQDFSLGTEMNAFAEEHGFYVLYPEQSTEANGGRCWNWFEPEHQQRAKGEPSILADMTSDVIKKYRINAKQVYVAGLSAGGAMSVILGATYPDLYAAIGVHSGLEYQAGTDLPSAVGAMFLGGPDPIGQGKLAFEAMQEHHRPVPVIVFHGDSDKTVNITNGHQVLTQWSVTNDYADDGLRNQSIRDDVFEITQGQIADGYSYTQSKYVDSRKKLIMEKWIVSDLPHSWSGGNTSGSYTDPKGPKASAEMVRFFKQFKLKAE
ncbi:PHB depolymerase family esterase [Ammoniphilus sp. YIM 78166]|uniref:extracellular catalytic domain type 1 short-chain-length polyhydroxyalkanoate depolymerase n=1 Tax=Ammoniphilus sp. YIM 78166 TaxID=1644106 RepID=UPI00196B3A20|nr:PHB depolymerase family esterase [Ammoniphilus sp. YIM 78166]